MKQIKNIFCTLWTMLMIAPFLAGIACIIMSAFKPNTMAYLGRALAFFVAYEIFAWWSKATYKNFKKRKEQEADKKA